jgi:hypothetical protein
MKYAPLAAIAVAAALAAVGCGSTTKVVTPSASTATTQAAPATATLVQSLSNRGARADINDSRADNVYYIGLLDAPGFQHAAEGWRGSWRNTAEDPNPDFPSVYFWVYDSTAHASAALAGFSGSDLSSGVHQSERILWATTGDASLEYPQSSDVTEALAQANA